MKAGTKIDYRLSDGRGAKTYVQGGFKKHNSAGTEKGVLSTRVFQAYVALSVCLFQFFKGKFVFLGCQKFTELEGHKWLNRSTED